MARQQKPIAVRYAWFTECAPYAALSIIFLVLVVVGAIALLQVSFPTILDGNNPFRNFFEIMFFAAGTTAFAGLLFALKQASEAERTRIESQQTRIAGLYIALEERWASPQIQAGTRRFYELLSEYYRNNPVHPDELESFLRQHLPPMQRFVHQKLVEIMNSGASGSGSHNDYYNIMYVAHFFEYLAFLIYADSNRIDINEIKILYGDMALEFYTFMEFHFNELRKYHEAFNRSQGRSRPPTPFGLYRDLAGDLRALFA